MTTLLQTRAVDFISLSEKDLVSDLKDAATCEVRNVCSLPCHRCPYLMNNIDVSKIHLKGLENYTIELIKQDDERLFLDITAKNLDKWLTTNHLDYQHSSEAYRYTSPLEFSVHL